MKKQLTILTLIALICMTASMAHAWGYNYISPEKVKASIETKAPLHIVDIQIKEAFDKHHLPGAMKTYSYPVKSDSDKAKVAPLLPQLKKDNAPIAVICPRGKGGAKRTVDYLIEQGIPESRLFILTNGQDGWPYPDMLQGK